MKFSCPCSNLGHCPFQQDWTRMTYTDGTPVYRAATDEERAAFDKTDGAGLQEGDFVGVDDNDQVELAARALDPARAVQRARACTGRKCKADSFFWRKLHPYPTK